MTLQCADLQCRCNAVQCDWCENEANYSINWVCGPASAMCQVCFDPVSDEQGARYWSMDIMDWGDYPICPDCAG
jgi:hypothetical protein